MCDGFSRLQNTQGGCFPRSSGSGNIAANVYAGLIRGNDSCFSACNDGPWNLVVEEQREHKAASAAPTTTEGNSLTFTTDRFMMLMQVVPYVC